MPRDIPIGNGGYLITFDWDYSIRDIYYPFVGKENHTEGRKFRFGVWADGVFKWVDRSWDIRLDYAGESLLLLRSGREGFDPLQGRLLFPPLLKIKWV